jgi:hypothetical protein
MSLVNRGAHRASGRHPVTTVTTVSPHSSDTSGDRPDPSSPRRTRRPAIVSILAILALLATALPLSLALPTPQSAAAGDYLLMPRAELLKLPTTGTAWSDLKKIADGSLGSPDLCDINADHHLRTLAAALVYARTGTASYGTKARAGVMAGMASLTIGCSQAILSLGRQLTAYVLAADFAGLSGANETSFRAWLTNIRTRDVGGHTVWRTLAGTHADSANNWGAYAGASRIAASLYLGDTHDVDIAARITRGFLGDRTAYAKFGYNLDGTDLSWSCVGSATYTPVNRSCTKNGINVDGAVIADISRGGSLTWPPKDPGINYQLEAIQGLGLQVELLYRHGYPNAWTWSSSALKRMAGVVSRSDASGGTGWNETQTGSQMPWLLDQRYGLSIPRKASAMGRAIGFTDWLYSGASSGTGSSTPKPTATPTPKPTSTSTAKPTPTPTPTPTPKPAASPTTTFTWFGPAKTTSVPKTGVPTLVKWKLKSSSDGVKRYELQRKHGTGSWTSVSLGSSTSTSKWLTLYGGDEAFRVRATDKSGRVGSWNTIGPRVATVASEGSSNASWSSGWSSASLDSYIGGKVRWSRTTNATAVFKFTGTNIAVVGPVGPTRGKAKVYLDGVYQATVDTYASSFASRRVLYATSVPSGTHRLTIKVAGTAGHPVVAIDAWYVEAPG